MKFVMYLIFTICMMLIGYYAGKQDARLYYENNPHACLSVCVEEFEKMGC